MHKIHLSLLALVLILVTGSSSAQAQQRAVQQIRATSSNRAHLATAHFTRLGMMCMICHHKVVQAVSAVPGVIRSRVDLEKDDVIVRYDAHKTSAKAIAAAIARAGFRPRY